MGYKFGSAVRRDMRRNAVLGKYVNNKEFRQLSRSDSIQGRNENGVFCEAVYHYQDRSIRIVGGRRELFDEIH